MDLVDLGWNACLELTFGLKEYSGLTPARIAREDRRRYLLLCSQGEVESECSGKLRHEAPDRGALPAVGDWVAARMHGGERRATIVSVVPRRTHFSRKVVGGRTEQQVVAANIDIVFVVCALDGGRNFNLRRLERYLTLAQRSGARPVIVLNKADTCADVRSRIREAGTVAGGIPIHASSALRGEGIDALEKYISRGKTAVLLGSSGVGKSALVNRLLGTSRQAVGRVREDDKRGRHTTTRRELILLPGGGVVIDTPGVRELQLWADEGTASGAFDDIEQFAAECRFRDCRHEREPGCAVRRAVAEGVFDLARLENYLQFRNELESLARRRDDRFQREEKARWRKISILSRKIKKGRSWG